jgi:hypothetical protein
MDKNTIYWILRIAGLVAILGALYFFFFHL